MSWSRIIDVLTGVFLGGSVVSMLMLRRIPEKVAPEPVRVPSTPHQSSISFPKEHRCLMARGDYGAIRAFQALLTRQGTVWQDVGSCPHDYLGACSVHIDEPEVVVVTLYAYNLDDALALSRSCDEKRMSWIP